ncbi:MAG: response regulator [bacterium]|nr:response regulator [bacterium]
MKNKLDKRILIVDDDDVFLGLLNEKFTFEGFDVIKAVDGEEALDQIKINPNIDVILADLVMPRVDGVDLIKTIRENNNQTPFVILSNSNEIEDIDKIKKFPSTHYLLKSELDLSELIKLVKNILNINE